MRRATRNLEVPNFRKYCRPFPTPRAEFQKLRWLGFPLTLHCFALFNHGQVTPFIVYIAAFGRFMRHSRIQKHFNRHMYSRCMVRSGNAPAPKASGRVSAKRELRSSPAREPKRSEFNYKPEVDFHLTQNGNRHFTLCFQGRGDFHTSKIGEPPRLLFLWCRGESMVLL